MHTSLLGGSGKGAGEWLCYRVFAPDRDGNKHTPHHDCPSMEPAMKSAGRCCLPHSPSSLSHTAASAFTFHSGKQTKFILLIRKSPVKEMRLTDPSRVPRPEKCWTPSQLSAGGCGGSGRLSCTNGRLPLSFSGEGRRCWIKGSCPGFLCHCYL